MADEPSTSKSSNGRLFTLVKSPRFASESSLIPQSRMKTCQPEIDLERELHYLHKEMEHIQLECDRLIAEHVEVEQQVQKQLNQTQKQINTTTIYATPPFYPKFVNKQKMPNIQAPIVAQEDTSSAYNTGNDSCRSTPMNNVDSTPPKCTQSAAYDLSKFNNNLIGSKKMGAQSSLTLATSQPSRNSYINQQSALENESSSEFTNSNSNIFFPDELNLYTDPANLHRTILFQQRLLRQAMIQQAYRLKAEQEHVSNQQTKFSLEAIDKSMQFQNGEGIRLEWKVRD